MRLTRRVQRFAQVVFSFVLALLAAAPEASAQEDKVLQALLQDARDPRVRARAASALGRSRSPTAAAVLSAALADRHPAVRVAAVAALGQLGVVEALPALKKCTRDPALAKHARLSIAQIELAQRRHDKAPQGRGAVRYRVWIGELRDRSSAPDVGMLPVLAHSLDATLRGIDGVSVHDLEAPTDGVPIYRVDGQITDSERGMIEDKVTAHASVALLLTAESDKTLRIVFKGSSTTIEDLDRRATSQRERVAQLAVERAVRAALRNASTAMHEALARR